MTPEIEHTFTPILRFPEFRDWPRWKKRKLSYLLSEPKRRNRDLKYGANGVLSVSGEFGCVNQIELLGRSYAGVSVENYHVVEKGDIVYTKSPLKKNPYGIIKANKEKAGIVSTLYAVYRPTDKCHADYLDYYFTRDYNLNAYLQPLVKKGPKNDMKINNSDVLIGEVWVPEVEEQKKIAECLSAMDWLIGAESQKLEALKSHKKALMQQLFPGDGETSPHFRFPEFRNTPEWEEKKIDTIANPVSERVGDQTKNIILTLSAGHGLVLQSEYFGKKIAGNNAERYLKIQRDDFVYNDRTTKAFAYGTIKRLTKHPHGIVSPIYKCFRFNEGEVPSFWEWYFEAGIHDSQLRGLANEGARTGRFNFSIDLFLSTSVRVPMLNEQRKIATCLSSLDDLIIAQSGKVEGLKTHKRGLLQQLFPFPSEPDA